MTVVRSATRLVLLGVLGVVCALPAPNDAGWSTHGLHSASRPGATHTFGGASFVPNVAPAVSATLMGSDVELKWPRVTTSAGTDVQYAVSRTGPDGATQVCVGANAPVVVGETASCIDTSIVADATYTYTEQPVLLRSSTTTWTRPASAPSSTVTAPRIVFSSVGPTVSSTGALATVPYPTGTQIGDLLLLVFVSGRQNSPVLPAGWTSLASVGTGGSTALRLVLAWRLADGASSVAFDPSANATGATARIIRYVRGRGNVATPVTAATTVTSATSGVATFTPTPDVSTTAANARVLNFVAVRTASAPVVASARGFVVEDAEFGSPGTVDQGLAVAGLQAITAGPVASPTWTAPAATVWASVTVAFR